MLAEALRGNKHLRILNLEGCVDLTDDGADSLLGAVSSSGLTRVNLLGTSVYAHKQSAVVAGRPSLTDCLRSQDRALEDRVREPLHQELTAANPCQRSR